MKNLNLHLTSLFIFLVVFQVKSQNYDENLPALNYSIPPSPDAGSLGKFVDVPVNHYTGIPDISVPITTIQSRRLSLPVSLNYHAGGNKIDEVASWVGLGWSLNAGGAISRTTRGLPDDDMNGYLNTPAIPNLQEAGEGGAALHYSLVRDFAEGRVDSQPDVFNLTVPGMSFKFFFQKDGSIGTIPQKDIELTPSYLNSKIVKWTLIDGKGTIYTFEETEETDAINLGATSVTRISQHINTWYLSKIQTPQKDDEITFTYDPYISKYLMNPSETFKENSLENEQISRLKIFGKRLKRIEYTGGKVEFNPDTQGRCDLIGSHRLASIDLFYSGQPVKKFVLTHSYFDKTGITTYGSSCDTGGGYWDNDPWKRLKFDEIVEEDAVGDRLPYRTFNYSSVLLPKRHSKSQDHWGFYNGKINSTLVPPYKIGLASNADYLTYHYYDGGDRSSDENFSKAGILTKVEYPTGGWTEYEYEGNTCESEYLPNDILQDSNLVVGETSPTQSFTVASVNELFLFLNIQPIQIPFTDPNCLVRLSIKDLGDNTTRNFDFNKDSTAPVKIKIKGGNYEISHLILNQSCTTTDPYGFNITWENEYLKNNKPVGGLRVSKVSSYSDALAEPVVKSYSYINDSGFSNGVLNTVPFYGYHRTSHFSGPSPVYSFYRTSNSNWNLDFTGGSPVGYSEVTETNGDIENNGKTVYSYYTALENPDQTDQALHGIGHSLEISIAHIYGDSIGYHWYSTHTISQMYPFAPFDSKSWARGELKDVKVYADGDNDPVQITQNNHIFMGMSGPSIEFRSSMGVVANIEPAPFNETSVSYNEYSIEEGRYFLMTSTQTSYADDRSIEMITANNYAPYSNAFLLKSKISDYGNIKYKTEYIYLNDLDLSADAVVGVNEDYNALKTLKEDYKVINTPIEVITSASKDGGTTYTFVSAQFTRFGKFNDEFYPSEIYTLTGKALTGAFQHLATSGNALVSQPEYVLRDKVLAIDAYGNITKIKGSDGQIQEFVFDTLHHKYIETVHVKDDNDNIIQTTKYKHKPGFGIKEKTDPNNKPLKYSYDGHGRLVMVKDHANQVIQRIDYHLKNDN